jgi:hypothetical protein
MALHAIPVPSQTADPLADSGWLYVGCGDGVYGFNLTQRTRRHFPKSALMSQRTITGMAVTEDGARLFVVAQHFIEVMDTRTGVFTTLVRAIRSALSTGPVTSDPATSSGVHCVIGCLLDQATRSLILSDAAANRIVRLRSIEV